jgi:hypothetical protein
MLVCNTCERNEDEVKIIKKTDTCISCNKKIYYQENKESIKLKSKIYSINNKETIQEWKKEYYNKNKEVIRIKSIKYYDNNKEIVIEKVREYRENNKEKGIEYRKNNKEKRNERRRERLQNDNLYRLSQYTRNKIRKYLIEGGYSKKSKTQEILGCSFEELKLHLESKFEGWMNWTNRGLYNGELNYGWDIDHIIPLSIAKSEEDIIRLNNYSNLQPLCSKINRDIKKDNFELIYTT